MGVVVVFFIVVFFFKQKTAYELRISDWSSDVCSSDLDLVGGHDVGPFQRRLAAFDAGLAQQAHDPGAGHAGEEGAVRRGRQRDAVLDDPEVGGGELGDVVPGVEQDRSEEHTSEVQSLMCISYAVFCLKKKYSTRGGRNLCVDLLILISSCI